MGKNRVNIEAQANGETDEKIVSGAWLVEFDNYENENQISINISDTYLERFLVTYHTPDSLSEAQYNYLLNEWQTIKDALFEHNSSILWDHIDLDALTQYLMIAEIMSAQEAFTGSCWLHKDAGESKWKFGPVWDFGNSITAYWRNFMWADNYWGSTIETEFAQFDELQNSLKQKWPSFYEKAYPHVDEYIDQFAEEIAEAAKHDYLRWPKYGCPDVIKNAQYVKTCMQQRIEWLNSQWSSTTLVNESPNWSRRSFNKVFMIDGREVKQVGRKGVYIVDGLKVVR